MKSYSMLNSFGITLVVLVIQHGSCDSEPAAATKNKQIAAQCNVLPMAKDCNWDPALVDLAEKPTKAGAFFCSYTGTGNLTIFMTGNDFASRQLAGVKKALSTYYKKLYFAARPVCLIFEDFNKDYAENWKCGEVYNFTARFLEKVKPDMMIISQRVSNNQAFQSPVESVDAAVSDPAAQQVADYFQMWSKDTKKIFYIEPQPTLPINPPVIIAKEIIDGKDLSNRFLDPDTLNGIVDPGWYRIQAAMKSCPKCAPIPMRNAFIEDSKYYYYDQSSNISYYCDNYHFSPPGVAKMVPVIKDAVVKVLKDISP